MRTQRVLFIAASLVASLTACGDPSTANASDDIAQTCAMCHSGERSFKGQDASTVAAGIKSVIEGKTPHPPLGLVDVSDKAVEKLANSLTSK